MKILNITGSANWKGRVVFLRLFLFSLVFCPLTTIHSPLPLSAAVPGKFTYQGNLRQAGFLVNGRRSMVFRVYASSSAVSPLWTSAALDVEVSTGVFRAALEPVIADWESGSLWLELEVAGTKLSPREELTSAPYAVNALLHSGKRYTTAASAPAGATIGDLWMDTVSSTLKFWNGTVWMLTSGAGVPGSHASTHAGGGSDPILNLGGHTVTGAVTFDSLGELRASGGVFAITITTHAVVQGTLNPASNLAVGGAGYSVAFASSVSAGWFHGDGAALTGLNASALASGYMNSDRLAPGVLVSTHIANRGIDRLKFSNSGCGNGQVLKWDLSTSYWICADDNFAGGGEADPLSVHLQSTLQANATFYVSSGTVIDLNVTNLNVGTAVFPGASGIRINDGLTGQLLRKNAGGGLEWIDTFTGDHLGNHTATQALNMAGFNILSAGSLSAVSAGFSGPVTASSFTASSAAGIYANRHMLSAGVEISSTTGAQYGGVYVSTHIYTPGNVYAAKIYGDLTDATGFPAAVGDNLGNHVATTTLSMADFDITNVSTVTVSTISLRGSGAGIVVSSHVYVTGDVYAAKFYGDLTGATGFPAAVGDNLGSHVATTTLSMADFDITNVSTVTVSTISLRGAGAGIVVSSHVYVTGDVYAAKFYGDLTGATGFPAAVGDNLGNHVATTTLSMANFDITNVSTVTVSTISLRGAGAGIVVSSHVYVIGDVYAAKFYGDLTGATGFPAAVGDNLGSHVATTTLNMATFNIVNVGSITANAAITTYSSMTVAGNLAVSTVIASGNITAARYQINGSTVLAILPGAGSLGVGVGAGVVNTGEYNLFAGIDAGGFNTTGTNNSFLGHGAGGSNSTGGNNSFVGKYAAVQNITGANNSYLGHHSGYSNKTGSANAILGSEAGYGVTNNSFSSSTLVGYHAGYGLSTGSDNILLGFQAGDSLTSGTRNIIIGYDKDAPAATTSNHLNIGDAIYGDLSTGFIGIGEPVPGARLHVAGQVKITGGTPGAGKVLTSDGAGLATWETAPVGAGDNLGNHVATTTLNMATFNLVNVGSITANAAITTYSSMTVAGNLAVSTVIASGNITAARYQINGSTVLAILPGTGSMAVGVDAGQVSNGAYNSFIGYQAGYVNTTGSDNLFAGFNAGHSNIGGAGNSFLGSYSGWSNTSGSYNSFVGQYAGYWNTSAWYNSFIGYAAGYNNSTGWYNSFMGGSAGEKNTTGVRNSFMGYSAGYANTTGENNSFLGYSAGYYTQAGSANAIFGSEAGKGVLDNSFSSATLMGYQAGYGLTTGSNNILLGFKAGDSLTTGANNIIIGYDKDAPAATTSNHLNIGGAVYGDLSTGFIGIGEPVPGARLHVAGQVKITGGSPGAGKVLTSDGSGLATWETLTTPVGDNLGNHVATTTLNMATFNIVNVGSITANAAITTYSSMTVAGNITAARYQINGSTVLAILPGTGSLGIGSDAGRSNTGGSNTFLGNTAGYSNTTGVENIFAGYQAGYDNTIGMENTFVGAFAGLTNNSGNYNSFVGYAAGRLNTTGSLNSFFGIQAGNGNTTGDSNSFVGYNAGYNTKTGMANAIFGNEAGYGVPNQSFSRSTLMGYHAGYGLSTGSENILVGYQSGDSIDTGTRNLIIGYDQDASAPTANNELNIGGVLFGDLSAKTIGISTRVPQAALDIVSTGTLISQYAQIWRNSAGTIVSSMTATGVLYPQSTPAGDNLGDHTATKVLDMASKPIINISSLTVMAPDTIPNELWLSTSATTPHLYVSTGGNVGIGTASPSAKLEVAAAGMSFQINPNASFVSILLNGLEAARIKP